MSEMSTINLTENQDMTPSFYYGERRSRNLKKIKILVVEPNKKICEKVIKNTIDEIYGLVFYPYKEIEIQKDIFVIYSKEATDLKDKMFKENRTINNISIYGTFVIVAKKNNNLISLTENQIQEIKDLFLER